MYKDLLKSVLSTLFTVLLEENVFVRSFVHMSERLLRSAIVGPMDGKKKTEHTLKLIKPMSGRVLINSSSILLSSS